MEKVLPIKEFPGYYITNTGIVYSKKNAKNIQISRRVLSSGYVYVSLYIKNKSYLRTVHRLVAETFIPNPNNKSQVNHIDGNKLNNCTDNLEWVDNSENQRHRFRCLHQRDVKIQKPVLQIKDNIVIAEFKSAYIAKKITGATHIGLCCKGKRLSSGGYKWKYKEKGELKCTKCSET